MCILEYYKWFYFDNAVHRYASLYYSDMWVTIQKEKDKIIFLYFCTEKVKKEKRKIKTPKKRKSAKKGKSHILDEGRTESNLPFFANKKEDSVQDDGKVFNGTKQKEEKI